MFFALKLILKENGKIAKNNRVEGEDIQNKREVGKVNISQRNFFGC